jgi:hypothetical protein
MLCLMRYENRTGGEDLLSIGAFLRARFGIMMPVLFLAD